MKNLEEKWENLKAKGGKFFVGYWFKLNPYTITHPTTLTDVVKFSHIHFIVS